MDLTNWFNGGMSVLKNIMSGDVLPNSAKGVRLQNESVYRQHCSGTASQILLRNKERDELIPIE